MLWDGSIGFRPDPKPGVAGPLGVIDATPTAETHRPTPPRHWTVDRVPIDWALEEPKKLQVLLVRSIDANIALMEAENVGLSRVDQPRGWPR